MGADNTYGHPTDKALGFLEALGIAAFRSDQQGTLTLGKNSAGALVVWSQKEEPSG